MLILHHCVFQLKDWLVLRLPVSLNIWPPACPCDGRRTAQKFYIAIGLGLPWLLLCYELLGLCIRGTRTKWRCLGFEDGAVIDNFTYLFVLLNFAIVFVLLFYLLLPIIFDYS